VRFREMKIIMKISLVLLVCLLITMPLPTTKILGSSDPLLLVLQPNGGERWGANETHIIAWASSDLSPEGRIFIYVGFEGNWKKISGPIPTTLNAWSWQTKDVGFTSAKIKVACYVGADCQVTDTSDGVVTFAGSTAHLEPPALKQPLNGTIAVSTKPTFIWNKVNSAYSYRIQISRFENFSKVYLDRWVIGGVIFTPELTLPGDSTLYWRVASYNSNGVPSLWSYPWILSTGKSDNADYFTASGKITNEIGQPIEGVNIDFVCDNSNRIQAPSSVLTDFQGNWSQTGFKAGFKFRVMPNKPVYSFSPNQKNVELWNSTSINFFAVPQFMGGINVAWPNGTETISAGTRQLIRWTSTDLDPSGGIYIYLIKSIGEPELIAGPVTTGASTFDWFTPNYNIISAKIRIECKVGDKITSLDESDWWFKISKDPEIPLRPTLISPIYGEKWVSIYPTLSWQRITGYDNYNVQLSDNQYFTNLILDRYTSNSWIDVTPILNRGMKYYWRVKAFNNSTNDTTEWSYWNHFETGYGREEETWQAQGWVRDENGNGVYGCMISFVSVNNNVKNPPVSVTNKDGFWTRTGFVKDEKYNVYPAIQGANFVPTTRIIEEGFAGSVNFTVFGLGSSAQISVRLPTAGSYKRGTTQSISWSTTGIPDDAVFYVSLLHDNKVTQIQGPLSSDARYLVWTIPDIITGDAKIRVQAWKNSQIISEAKGAQFAITGP
jgi:hypothetical protein